MMLESLFISRAQTRLVQHFLNNIGRYMNMSAIAEESGMAHSTIHRVIQPLVDMNIIDEISAGAQARLFIMEPTNKMTKVLVRFVYDMESSLS